MTFDEYQAATGKTNIYTEAIKDLLWPIVDPQATPPEKRERLREVVKIMEYSYVILGLVGEAGELANKAKKRIRDGKFDIHDASKELGDVQWYLSEAATQIEYPLTLIAIRNLAKLSDRQERDVLSGAGDDR